MMKRAAQRSSLVAALLLTAACEPAAPSAGSRQVTDDLGRTVVVPQRISRVVTLAPNLTEIVFAAGGGERLVGADQFSDYPPEAKQLPRVGGMQPDVEKVVALEPDLVLASTEGNQPAIAPSLAAAGVPLYVVRTDRLDEIPTSLSRIGELLGTGNGETAASTLRDQIRRQLRHRDRQPRILFAVWADPLYVAGLETFTDDLFALTGSRNAVGVKGWPQFSQETLLANPPDIILYPGTAVSRASVEKLFAAAPEVLRGVTLVAVDDNRFTRPGPRVAEAAAELNAIVDQWQVRN
jgi:iron complex transport system substrate-binding protein